METYDRLNMLDSMTILVDSREQPTDRAKKRYEAFGFPYRRSTLSYGDYTYNAKLPNGNWLLDLDKTVKGKCIVERKMSLDELASCFTHSRDRFEREFQRAKENNSRIILLVENASWENLLAGKYRSKFRPASFYGSLTAWMIRYDMQIIFCKQELSGKMIREFLYRDLRERIERGEFDEDRGYQG